MTVVGDGVTGADGVNLGTNCQVLPGLFLAPGSVVAPGVVQAESIVVCVDVNGLASVVPLSQCGSPTTPAFALGFVPGFDNATGPVEPPGQSVTPVDPGALPPDLQDLADDIGGDVAPPNNGGTGQPYADTTHDCDDFAEELRAKLAALGYTTTFTVIFDINPNWAWWKWWVPKLINGHALTDVHRPGDGTIWIEAQWTGAQGAAGIDLDDDNDGQVTYEEGPGDTATDGTKRIEVYDSLQDAVDSGRAVD
jgi:hypothetical protein